MQALLPEYVPCRPKSRGLITWKRVSVGKGSPSQVNVDPKIKDAIRASLAAGKGILKTARECGVGSSTVQRVKAAMASR